VWDPARPPDWEAGGLLAGERLLSALGARLPLCLNEGREHVRDQFARPALELEAEVERDQVEAPVARVFEQAGDLDDPPAQPVELGDNERLHAAGPVGFRDLGRFVEYVP